jgi:hypothetical protein
MEAQRPRHRSADAHNVGSIPDELFERFLTLASTARHTEKHERQLKALAATLQFDKSATTRFRQDVARFSACDGRMYVCTTATAADALSHCCTQACEIRECLPAGAWHDAVIAAIRSTVSYRNGNDRLKTAVQNSVSPQFGYY